MGFTRTERAAQARASERAEWQRATAREQAVLRARAERQAWRQREVEAEERAAAMMERLRQRARAERADAEREQARARTRQTVQRAEHIQEMRKASAHQQARRVTEPNRLVPKERPVRRASLPRPRRAPLPTFQSTRLPIVFARPRATIPRQVDTGWRKRIVPAKRTPGSGSRLPRIRIDDRARAAPTRPRSVMPPRSRLQRALLPKANATPRARRVSEREKRPTSNGVRAVARPPALSAAQQADQQQRKRERAREAARQARLQDARAAEARQRKLVERMQELAGQRRDERLAARRVTGARVPSGPLSGPLPWLHATGPYLLDEMERPVTLRGVTATWLEHPAPLEADFPAALDDRSLAVLQLWGANALAVPIAQDVLLFGSYNAGPSAYFEALDATIARAAEAGIYTILRLSVLSSAQPRPDLALPRDRFDPALPDLCSLDAWSLLAQRYANESAVIYDLFRSPHDSKPGDATRTLVAHVGWTLWRRWLLALLGEVRRQHPRALAIMRGIARGRDLTGFPLLYTDGSSPANVLYAAELSSRDGRDEPVGLASLARDYPVGVMSWWAEAGDVAAVQAQGRRLARNGWHWLAAGFDDWIMPLVTPQAVGVPRPTALGRAFQFALGQPVAPAAHVDLSAAQARGVPPLPIPDPRLATGRPGPSRRDPFAPPGYPGNRWVRYGDDGSIPVAYRGRVDQALDIVYMLALRPEVTSVFASVISQLTGKTLGPDALLEALDKMVLHMADSTRDPRIRVELERDSEALRMDRTYQRPPAYSVPNQPNIWLLEFQLRKSVRVIAGSVLHEAMHVAGAPSHLLAEFALDAIHKAAGLPRL
jgi:hypothetical protein